MEKRILLLLVVLLSANFGLSGQSKEKSINKYKVFMAKANQAGLSKERTIGLLKLVYEKDMKLKENKLESNREIKQEFNKKMVELLNTDEYRVIFGDRLKKVAEKYAKQEVRTITKNHQLTSGQEEQVQAMVSQYYFIEAVGNFYYQYDKKKQGEQLRTLRLYYEKQYKTLMESFGVNINAYEKANTTGFLY